MEEITPKQVLAVRCPTAAQRQERIVNLALANHVPSHIVTAD